MKPTILLARFRFHKLHALLKAHRESKVVAPKRKKLKFCDPALYRPLNCPHCCEGTLVVFQRPLGDEWACCPGCGFADDVPGTVAVSLGCTLEEAVEFLVFQHNLHHVSKEEIEQYLHEKARYTWFADLLKERLYRNYRFSDADADHGLGHEILYKTLGDLNLRTYIADDADFVFYLTKKDRVRRSTQTHSYRSSDPRRRDHDPVRQLPGQFPTDFFGFTYASIVESWFFPHLYIPKTGKVRANTSPNRLFHGRNWGLVLVIPLQDVPGHFCGILCVGFDGRYSNDYVIRLFPDYNRRTTNTGFILPFRAFQKMQVIKQQYEDPETEPEDKSEPFLIAYNNPLHLIRTLIQNSRVSTPPMIGWIDFHENAPMLRTSDWSAFSDIPNKIFWMHRHDNRTMRTVIEQDGKILQYDMTFPYPNVDEFRICGNPVFRPNFMAVARMEVDGTPWPDYFAELFKHLSPPEAVDMLQQVTMNRKRFDECLARLPSTPEVQLVRRFSAKSAPISGHRVGQYELFEEPAGWFRKTDRQTTPKLVSDVRCYIDRVLLNSRGAKRFYRGRILYGERTIKFRVRVSRFDKDIIGCIRSILRKYNFPEPTFDCKNRFYKAAVFAVSRMQRIHPKR